MNMKNDAVGIIAENIGPGSDRGCLNLKPLVFMVLVLWFGTVSFLASEGAFVGRADSPPLALFVGLAIPLAVFLVAYFRWSAFRAFILGADLRLVTAMQSWRWAGLGFLFLYAKGILPGLFAWPAGLGDMAIGVSAPWILLALVRDRSFAGSRRYVVWNIMGIVDFIVAVSMGVVCSGFIPGIGGLTGNLTTSSMGQLPLVLVPVFVVPFFLMLHFTALVQARRLFGV